MHVPDGFIGPQTYVPATAIGAGLWALAFRRVRASLDVQALPRLGVLTAVSFVLMMVSIPIPGGSTVHFSGVALIALLFGGWAAFLCVSIVLLMQAALFGVGGVTSLPVAALTVGFIGAWVAVIGARVMRPLGHRASLFAGAWLSIVIPATVMALVLGLQPQFAQDASGRPLFFPFGVDVTMVSIVAPHLAVGVGEAILTVMMIEALRRMGVQPARLKAAS